MRENIIHYKSHTPWIAATNINNINKHTLDYIKIIGIIINDLNIQCDVVRQMS